MCSACEDEAIGTRVLPEPQLIRLAREIESVAPGTHVPADAWNIYFGLAGGSVEYWHFQRMHQAMEQADKGRIRLRRGLRRIPTNHRHIP
jgi:hypothetical protein